MISYLPYIAPAAILAGATLTSLNAGARLTGFGFIFFTLGSTGFALHSLLTNDGFGLLVNSALVFINAFGMHRWLRHNAVIEDAGVRTQELSARSLSTPTVVTASLFTSAKVRCDDDMIGESVDAVVNCASGQILYAVVHRKGAHAGTGFEGFAMSDISFDHGEIVLPSGCSAGQPLDEYEWPAQLRVEPTERDGESAVTVTISR